MCRLRGPLWQLWVATWRPKRQLPLAAERGGGESNSVLEPYGIRQTAKFRWQRAIMPYAMGFQRNTQKPKENHHISWFCAARGHASKSFFREFSVLGALWVTSGRPLATLGRHVSALESS